MQQRSYKIAVVFIITLLCLVLGLSMAAILRPASRGTDYIADIYQDGSLLASFPLDGSGDTRRFIVTGENGCFNEIEIRPRTIGIVSASCPDKLCVHQGFIGAPGLPVVCLPNRLVIQLREAEPGAVDAVAY